MPRKKEVIKSWCGPCGKYRYGTWNQACTIVLHQTRKMGTPLRIYPCPVGTGQHITKKVGFNARQA